ncbi:hypothetical protein F5Y16DRAFT_399984 [Xylariaceae sp. FL0255]|nr:hypothetical protein F5Y16DRAFT_399984 [Xylariaceae sp. FL0255]
MVVWTKTSLIVTTARICRVFEEHKAHSLPRLLLYVQLMPVTVIIIVRLPQLQSRQTSSKLPMMHSVTSVIAIIGLAVPFLALVDAKPLLAAERQAPISWCCTVGCGTCIAQTPDCDCSFFPGFYDCCATAGVNQPDGTTKYVNEKGEAIIILGST